MAAPTDTDRVLAFVRSRGATTGRDLRAAGLPAYPLYRLLDRGLLYRAGPGVYEDAAGAGVTEHHGLVTVARRVPRGVICLLSALRFHGLTTQNPYQVWVAVPGKARVPADLRRTARVVWMSGAAHAAFAEVHVLEGVAVRVSSAAKTVVDCFNYRSAVGTDVAVEALRDCLDARAATPAEIGAAAVAAGVGRVVRPYLEAMI